MNKYSVFKAFAFVLPLILIPILIYLKSFRAAFYDYLISEDSITEYLQAIAYFLSGGIFVVVGIKGSSIGSHLQKVFFLIAGFGILLIAFEEISWGQRLFGIKTPEWFQKNNIQKEISFHNLEPIQKTIHIAYALTGFVFSFGWIPLRYDRSFIKLTPDIMSIIRMLKPYRYLMTYFLPIFLFYTYLSLTGSPGNYFTFNDQEIAELLLSLGFLMYSLEILKSLNQRLHDSQCDS